MNFPEGMVNPPPLSSKDQVALHAMAHRCNPAGPVNSHNPYLLTNACRLCMREVALFSICFTRIEDDRKDVGSE